MFRGRVPIDLPQSRVRLRLICPEFWRTRGINIRSFHSSSRRNLTILQLFDPSVYGEMETLEQAFQSLTHTRSNAFERTSLFLSQTGCCFQWWKGRWNPIRQSLLLPVDLQLQRKNGRLSEVPLALSKDYTNVALNAEIQHEFYVPISTHQITFLALSIDVLHQSLSS